MLHCPIHHLLYDLLKVDFILPSTKLLLAQYSHKITEVRIMEPFLTTKGLKVKDKSDLSFQTFLSKE